MAYECAAAGGGDGGNVDPADVVGDQEGLALRALSRNPQPHPGQPVDPGKEAARPGVVAAQCAPQVLERDAGEQQKQHGVDAPENPQLGAQRKPHWLCLRERRHHSASRTSLTPNSSMR